MTSRKKIAISITAVCVVLLVAVVTIVAVWAARQANVGSSFQGNYTANHVDATITGQYKLNGTNAVADSSDWTDLTTTSGNTITFNSEIGTEDEGATQTFNAVNSIILTAENDSIMFKYVITNTSDSDVSFTVTGEQQGTFTNLDVTYTYRVNDDEGEAQSLTIAEGVTVAPGTHITIYVDIAIADADLNATLNGSVNWTLTAI